MKISRSAFRQNSIIPAKYTCGGQDINTPLKFEDVQDGVKGFASVVEDPDAPTGT